MPTFNIGLVSESKAQFQDLVREVGVEFFDDDVSYVENNLEAFHPLNINFEQLSKYVDIEYNIETLKHNKKSNFITSFRKCTNQDFTITKINNISSFKYRLCPDFEIIQNESILRNNILNREDRVAIKLEIIKCKGDHCCKDDEKVARVLQQLVFSLYRTRKLV